VTDDDFAGLNAANRKRPGLTEGRLADLESSLGVSFPADYAQFLRWSDGWVGWIGDASYVRLHGTDELQIANDGRFRSAFPGLLAIGGDGGLETYAIDFRQALPNPGIVAVDRSSADERDIWPVAGGFLEALDAFGQTRASGDINER
jgi:hypothetical protein